MKTRLTTLLFAATFSTALAHAATVLPDACGSDKAKFDVETAKPATPAVIEPVAGKARVVFIETVINTGYPFGGPNFTTRFGVDGKWVGAASNNSYFVLDFDPGVHHLCSAVQSSFSAPKDKIGIAKFTAEAGKVYYLDFMITNKNSSGGVHFIQGANSPMAPAGTPPPPPTMVPGQANIDSSNGLGFLDEDDAKFRIKSSKISTATPQASDSNKP
jgi:hypothetical protein